ncbi:YihY family inner membrane protein [Thiomicrorhabdus sediminis]|uniref:YihY family inner membrane protein n=1 Tax=Thiomicrorhabdus sediminis TaxID=2580412 RepID=A0A4P9K799_9GAMM|nr:YihY family inner membrane protein [Thiomicrorhabdus sediminis]QCU90808.1 YihY family inner membrane protein [Thiomicrorhabdus sediminis]
MPSSEQINQSWPLLLKQVLHWRFWQRVFIHFKQHQGSDAVAILAYTTLVGIVPTIAVMLSLFSVSHYFASFETLVMDQVVRNFMPDSQPVIEEYIVRFSQQAAALKGPGLAVMLLTTLMLLWKIDQKLNGLWPERNERKWWRSVLNYLGISLLGPLLLGMSLVLSSSLMALPLIADTTPWIEKLTAGLKIVPLILAWLGFTALYKFVPRVRVPIRVALLAGFMAMVELELLKSGFAAYVKAFPTYAVVYGAMAAVPLFLLWLYLLWFLLIWNGSLVATLTKKAPRIDDETPAHPTKESADAQVRQTKKTISSHPKMEKT